MFFPHLVQLSMATDLLIDEFGSYIGPELEPDEDDDPKVKDVDEVSIYLSDEHHDEAADTDEDVPVIEVIVQEDKMDSSAAEDTSEPEVETIVKVEDTEDTQPLTDVSKREELKRKMSAVNQSVNTEQKDPKDDQYLYCEECESYFIQECELHGSHLFIPDTPVVLGVSDRARLTLPLSLEVRRSQIPGVGLGVFNCGEAVAKGTHYGPYEGEVMEKEDIESGYSWVIYKSRNCAKYIDAKRETHSNWMRYVNSARTEEEQNLVAFQYRGGVVYRCSRQLSVGEELLVWYGQDRYKNISFNYWDNKSTARGVISELPKIQVFSCSECPSSYTSQIFLHKHIMRNHDSLYITLSRTGEIRTKTSSSSSSRSLPNTTSNGHDTDKSFSRKASLKKHQPVHTGEKSYHCDQCGKKFSAGSSLKAHKRIHTGENLFHCDQCGKNFTSEGNLKIHQRVHTGEKPYHCEECGKDFTREDHLRTHRRMHTGENSFRCDQCGKNYNREDSLKRHQRVHTGENLYQCEQCGKNFTQSGDLKTHQRVHTGEKPYKCEQCGKNFTREASLRIHQRVHTGEKPYHCDQCGMAFAVSGHLIRHQRIHTGEKPYHCDLCGKKFNQSGELKIHRLVHTGEKRYHCDVCGRNFTTVSNLRTHQRVHTGKNLFPCGQCGKKFTSQGNLRIHQHVHTGDKMYHCHQCSKNFASQGNLTAHQRVHTGEKPYHCDQCGKNFSQSAKLKIHQLVHTVPVSSQMNPLGNTPCDS